MEMEMQLHGEEKELRNSFAVALSTQKVFGSVRRKCSQGATCHTFS